MEWKFQKNTKWKSRGQTKLTNALQTNFLLYKKNKCQNSNLSNSFEKKKPNTRKRELSNKLESIIHISAATLI